VALFSTPIVAIDTSTPCPALHSDLLDLSWLPCIVPHLQAATPHPDITGSLSLLTLYYCLHADCVLNKPTKSCLVTCVLSWRQQQADQEAARGRSRALPRVQPVRGLHVSFASLLHNRGCYDYSLCACCPSIVTIHSNDLGEQRPDARLVSLLSTSNRSSINLAHRH
jgi:hypothetical protein